MENHPLDRHRRLEHLEQVPGNGLTFAILISCEIELVRILERPLEVGDRFLLLVGHDVIR